MEDEHGVWSSALLQLVGELGESRVTTSRSCPHLFHAPGSAAEFAALLGTKEFLVPALGEDFRSQARWAASQVGES